MKEGKTGNGLLQEWVMKENGFATQTNLHRPFRRKIPMQSSLWRHPILYQIIAYVSTFANL